MHADLAQAAVLVGMPGPVETLLVAGVMLISGFFSLIGIAATAEINQTIMAIYERDTPVR